MTVVLDLGQEHGCFSHPMCDLYALIFSMFIQLKGRSKEDAFKIGYEICDAVTAMHPSPIKLKFEKV